MCKFVLRPPSHENADLIEVYQNNFVLDGKHPYTHPTPVFSFSPLENRSLQKNQETHPPTCVPYQFNVLLSPFARYSSTYWHLYVVIFVCDFGDSRPVHSNTVSLRGGGGGGRVRNWNLCPDQFPIGPEPGLLFKKKKALKKVSRCPLVSLRRYVSLEV